MRTQLNNGPEGPQLLWMLAKNLRKQASRWRPQHYNSPSKSLVSGRQRDDIVHWLSQLNKKFKFYPETFALSSALLDHFLQLVKAHPKYLKCIGIACFYLAAKVLEESEMVPGVRELLERSDCGCTRAELLRMEKVILDKLSWDASLPTALDFLHIFHSLVLAREPELLSGVVVTPARQLSLLTHKMLRCTPHHQLLTTPPSCRALAILSLELELFRPDWLPMTLALQALAQVSSEDLIRCRERMSQVLLNEGQTSCLKLPHNMYAVASAKATKRKAQLTEQDDYDLFDDIKKLYNEDGNESLGSSSGKNASTCGSELRQDCSSVPALQTVAN